MKRREILLGSALTVLKIKPAYTQTWPTKPIKVIVPFQPGGFSDIVVREVITRSKDYFDGTFVIENRPGAGGNLGSTAVAKATPDGHTLLHGSLSTYALNAALYEKLGHDPQRDLTPVALTAMVPFVLVINPKLNVSNFNSFINLLKTNPGKYSYGSAGQGTTSHIALHLLLEKTSTRAEHIPYKGTGAMLNDLLSGNINFAMASPAVIKELVISSKLIALMAVSPTRLRVLPQVPTSEEAGLKDYEAYSWGCLFAPAATPSVILDQLHTVFEKVLNNPNLILSFEMQGSVPMTGYTRASINSYIKKEYERWVPYVSKMGLKVE